MHVQLDVVIEDQPRALDQRGFVDADIVDLGGRLMPDAGEGHCVMSKERGAKA